MGKLRCWPGCLAYITGYRWDGRLVEVLKFHRHISAVESVEPGPYWLVKAIGWDVAHDGWRPPVDGVFAFPDHLLRPITPPPSADTETVEQILEAARGDAVEA